MRIITDQEVADWHRRRIEGLTQTYLAIEAIGRTQGKLNPNQEWISTPFDTSVRNPHYKEEIVR